MAQVKKTLHLNTHLVSNQLILDFFEAANEGRPFSGFAKDVLHEQALAYFNEDSTPVGNTPAINGIASKQSVEPRVTRNKPIDVPVSEELSEDGDDIDRKLDAAVENMFS